jgi:hypothetical protein
MMETDGGAQAAWTEEHLRGALDVVLHGGLYARNQAREDILSEHEQLAAQVAALTAEREALKLALRRLLGNIATGRPLHNGYSVYYDGHFPQDMIDWVSGVLNSATTPPAGAQEHEHDWKPAGFTRHPTSGGWMPTDQCRVCGAERYPYNPEVKAGAQEDTER